MLPFAEDLGALPQPWPPQSLPNCVSEPHPNSSRLCQGDWKFLPSSFSGRISTLGSAGDGEEPGCSRLSVLTALLGGNGRGASLGLGESFRNNCDNSQPVPTTVTLY